MSERDPEESPIIHRVLYTNDVSRLVGSMVGGLLTVAEPHQAREALERILENWDQNVEMFNQIHEQISKADGTSIGELDS